MIIILLLKKFLFEQSSVGKSAVWTKKGELAGQLDDKMEGILIFDTATEGIVIKHLNN